MRYSSIMFLSCTKTPCHIGVKDIIFGFLPLGARAFVAGIFCSATERMSRTNLSKRRKQKEAAK
jgi:hypothetical protein